MASLSLSLFLSLTPSYCREGERENEKWRQRLGDTATSRVKQERGREIGKETKRHTEIERWREGGRCGRKRQEKEGRGKEERERERERESERERDIDREREREREREELIRVWAYRNRLVTLSLKCLVF